MSDPTPVNSQITDAVTQANLKVPGDASALAMGNLFQAAAQALANAAHNASNAQQQSFITAQAATTMGISTLYSIDTAATGVATTRILDSAAPAAPAATPDTPAGVGLTMSDSTPSTAGLVAASVEQASAFTLGLAPAFALAQQYVLTTHALALQSLAQAAAQQEAATLTRAVTTVACTRILHVDGASLAAPQAP